MARIFAITTTTDAIQLDASGQGEVAFTITNNSDRFLEGQVKLRSQPPTDPSWLSLAQDIYLEFPKNATHNTTVQIKVPPGTAPGKYPFRIDVVSTAKPDEDFTEGPSVVFTVQPSKAPAKKPFPWWILAVAAVVLTVGGVFAWLLFFRSVAVPNVTGKRLELAVGELENKGFELTQTPKESNNPEEVGTVTEQRPEVGTKVKRGSNVALTFAVAPEQIQIPNEVIGSNLLTATQLLLQAGFTVGTATGDYNKTVVATTPPVGAPYPKGTTINITLEAPDSPGEGPGDLTTPVGICERIDCSIYIENLDYLDYIYLTPSP